MKNNPIGRCVEHLEQKLSSNLEKNKPMEKWIWPQAVWEKDSSMPLLGAEGREVTPRLWEQVSDSFPACEQECTVVTCCDQVMLWPGEGCVGTGCPWGCWAELLMLRAWPGLTVSRGVVVVSVHIISVLSTTGAWQGFLRRAQNCQHPSHTALRIETSLTLGYLP